ncbi:MAG: histidine phosphatase family protein [Muribaculum sp.]|nr:histidine phosphatase family protein [Muribaculum sp.]
MNYSKTFYALAFASLGLLSAKAQTAAQPTSHQMASHYYAYPYLDVAPPAQTPAPEGYVPFHLEHYGRHGSRWLINPNQYANPVNELTKAERAGKLTPLGQEVLNTVRDIQQKSTYRWGELSDIGALQHQAIGRRMYQNYPQIFQPGTHVDAKSTVVIRCILSMLNEIKELQALEPSLNITTDASYAEMYYMNHDHDSISRDWRKKARATALKEERAKYKASGEFAKRLISDPQFISDSINVSTLATDLANVLGNAQSHSDQPWLVDKVFSPDELHSEWMKRSLNWFVDAGNSALTGHTQPMEQRFLLRNFIESADTAMVSPGTSANLRFGHDTMVYPLSVLMELDDFGQEINDLSQVEGRMNDYMLVPMATNIQMIFYRPEGSTNPDDVLVKVMLNETERRLPIEPVSGLYYSWPKLREYYLNKIGTEN